MNLSFLHLGIVLACSVLIKGDWLTHELHLQWEKTHISLQDRVTDRCGNHTQYVGAFPHKCNICQDSVRAARFVVLNEMQQKIDALCGVMKGVHDQCIIRAMIYQDKVIRILFPGGPQGLCKMMRMCK